MVNRKNTLKSTRLIKINFVYNMYFSMNISALLAIRDLLFSFCRLLKANRLSFLD